MDDREAGAALVRDLRWQLEQMRSRRVTNSAGDPYNPSYFKRGLENAVQHGDPAVVEYVRGHLHKPPGVGWRNLRGAEALDLACESLVADEDKPYAHLFSDTDREAARDRLAPHMAVIDAHRVARRKRIDARRTRLPGDVTRLRALAGNAANAEDAVAINSTIVDRDPRDVVALNRLGRAYEALGQFAPAADAFRAVLGVDPDNAIATRRLRDVNRRAG